MAAQDHCFLLTQRMDKPHYRGVVRCFTEVLVPSHENKNIGCCS